MASFIRAISDTKAIRDLLRAARRCAILSIIAIMMAGVMIVTHANSGLLAWLLSFTGVWAELEALRLLRVINYIFRVERRSTPSSSGAAA